MPNTIHPIIVECIKNEIAVELQYNTLLDCVEYMVEGFSKAGNAKIRIEEDEILVFTRYEQTDTITSFEELADIAYEWFDKSCPKTWPAPPHCWRKAFIKQELITPTLTTTTVWR